MREEDSEHIDMPGNACGAHARTHTYTCAQFRSKCSGVGPQGWRTSGVEWDPRGGELVGWSGIPGAEWSGTPGVVVDPSLTLRDV